MMLADGRARAKPRVPTPEAIPECAIRRAGASGGAGAGGRMETSATTRNTAAVPDHLVDLAQGWRLWRTIRLRSAGFPIDMLEALAAPEAAAAVRNLIARERAFEAACREAEAACRRLVATCDDGDRKAWLAAARRLAKARLPDHVPDSAGGPDLASLSRGAEELEAAGAGAMSAIAAGLERTRERLCEVARDPLFREAVTWQNRHALRNAIDGFLNAPAAAANARVRSHRELLAKYLERYCAKNESIGFFGPVGWARFEDDGPPLDMRPGPGLVAERRLRFEYWAIDALARRLGADPGIRPWLAPRLHPAVRVEGDALVDPAGGVHRVSPAEARIASLCTGERSAETITRLCAGAESAGPIEREQVFRILRRMASAKLVAWELDVPVAPHPERALRTILEGIGDRDVRARALAALDECEAAAARVANARGDAEALETALSSLDQTFSRITGEAATHHHGRVYAGRTLVYEDCRRDVSLGLGPAVLDRLAPPLALVLQSARWYGHEIGLRFDRLMTQTFASLAGPRAARIPFAPFARAISNRDSALADIVREVAAELARRWSAILAPEEGLRTVERRSRDLGPQVAAAFAAPGPGWTNARYHSPDIMIAAEGPDAVLRGDYQFVLGEIHTGCNMIMPPWVLELHPDADELIAARERDMGAPLVFLVTPRVYIGHRKAPDSFSANDYQLAFSLDPPWRTGSQLLRVGELLVERGPEGLWVSTRDGRARLPAAALFEGMLIAASVSEFKLVAPAPHTPRIAIDDLIIARETWRFPAADLAFAAPKTTEERFLATLRWAEGRRLRRHVFVRVPHELKPVYVDLESPVSVDLFCHLLRRTAKLTPAGEAAISEMLPAPHETWLCDARGRRYASELRIAALDPVRWDGFASDTA